MVTIVKCDMSHEDWNRLRADVMDSAFMVVGICHDHANGCLESSERLGEYLADFRELSARVVAMAESVVGA